ncbi:MAG: S-adenosylmethionine:tRNA ribosyltransferase-isomerase [Paludibacteraceae bacterium]|nr:S-adenosylmethionine:tRNA ribosyltransferase-isomerase [Paludibacteraceae bacterium]
MEMEPILIDEYDYPLADERIAKYPLQERDQSKLLVYRDGKVSEDRFFNIGRYIDSQSLLIYNNTRVIQARMIFHKQSGARIEVFCLEPSSPRDYELSLGSMDGCEWKCMVGNLKKWKQGILVLPFSLNGCSYTLTAERLSTQGNTHIIRFRWDAPDTSFAEILNESGELPIPPYLNRATEESDKRTYQTVYSRIQGSVAAPTAGLHFTKALLDDLRANGVETAELTLHVGAGTFQPVKVADANEHVMHTEIFSVPIGTLRTLRQKTGHIVAVGTTSMRTLESLYWLGKRVLQSRPTKDMTEMRVGQHEPYLTQAENITTEQALDALIAYLERTGEQTLHAETQIMIRPGYTFHIVNQLITNFHQPRSTLLLLVSAFVGGDWQTIYKYALEHEFRFLSYGDSSILTRK